LASVNGQERFTVYSENGPSQKTGDDTGLGKMAQGTSGEVRNKHQPEGVHPNRFPYEWVMHHPLKEGGFDTITT